MKLYRYKASLVFKIFTKKVKSIVLVLFELSHDISIWKFRKLAEFPASVTFSVELLLASIRLALL